MNKLEEQYEEIHPKLYAFFYSRTGNRMTAQDLCHDTFLVRSQNLIWERFFVWGCIIQ